MADESGGVPATRAAGRGPVERSTARRAHTRLCVRQSLAQVLIALLVLPPAPGRRLASSDRLPALAAAETTRGGLRCGTVAVLRGPIVLPGVARLGALPGRHDVREGALAPGPSARRRRPAGRRGGDLPRSRERRGRRLLGRARRRDRRRRHRPRRAARPSGPVPAPRATGRAATAGCTWSSPRPRTRVSRAAGARPWSSRTARAARTASGSRSRPSARSSSAAWAASPPAITAWSAAPLTGPNQPPVVDAGPDQGVDLGSSAHLDGSVTDDGLPSDSVEAAWSKAQGPGDVTFTSPGSEDTDAAFSQAGAYVLRLTASDGELVGLRRRAGRRPGGERGPRRSTPGPT